MRGRKTGGRQEGTPNKATSTLHERVELEAGDPLPVLLTRIGVKAMREGDHQLAVMPRPSTFTPSSKNYATPTPHDQHNPHPSCSS